MKKSLASVLALSLLVATISSFAEAATSSKKRAVRKKAAPQSRKFQAKRKAMPKKGAKPASKTVSY